MANIGQKLNSIQEAIGRIEARQIISRNISKVSDAEFKVYSQWGEDGIIQHLINQQLTINPIFVEFGVETYKECVMFLITSRQLSVTLSALIFYMLNCLEQNLRL